MTKKELFAALATQPEDGEVVILAEDWEWFYIQHIYSLGSRSTVVLSINSLPLNKDLQTWLGKELDKELK